MSQVHRVATLEQLPPGTAREVVAGNRVIALFNVGGKIYALDGICPHAGGPLGEGILRGKIITCPWHGWQFDVTNGAHCLNPNNRQPRYYARAEGNDILVEIPDLGDTAERMPRTEETGEAGA